MPAGGIVKDIAGQKFNRLTAIRVVGRDRWQQAIWECRCDCGTICQRRGYEIRNGRSQSCGCLHIERISTHGCASHGSKTPEHRAWGAMKQRCTNPNNPRYDDWGGRGISVCPQWLNSFEQFLKDVGLRPSPLHELNRIDNDGDYTPKNVKWSTEKEQSRNRRSNRALTLHGVTKMITDWCRHLGVTSGCIHWRLAKGWSVEKALTKKSQRPA